MTEMTIIEHMEERAQKFGMQSYDFTHCDTLDIEFHPDWVEGTQFVYKHNGVGIDRDRAYRLIPGRRY